MRITTSKSHDAYIKAIASQMGSTSQEAINYLLWELRKANYQFGQSLPQYPMTNTQYPMPNAQQPQQQQHFDPDTYERATAMSALSWQPQSPQTIRDFETVQELQQEIDPIIEKFIGLGIVDQF